MGCWRELRRDWEVFGRRSFEMELESVGMEGFYLEVHTVFLKWLVNGFQR